MKTIVRSATVPYNAKQMFDLVNDIEQYPLFLPWCAQATIQSSSVNHMYGTLKISKGLWSHVFTTYNKLDDGKRIQLNLVDGPFKHLEGVWEFQPTNNEGSRVTFKLQFEFKQALLNLTVGNMIQPIAGTLVEEFTKRAHRIYGRS